MRHVTETLGVILKKGQIFRGKQVNNNFKTAKIPAIFKILKALPFKRKQKPKTYISP